MDNSKCMRCNFIPFKQCGLDMENSTNLKEKVL